MSKAKGKWLSNLIQQEIPAGSINGVNTTFTLSLVPNYPESLKLKLDSRPLYLGSDFTLSGAIITMIEAPAFGQQLDAEYIKKT